MEIRPFRGWRFRTSDGDVSPLIAPPYDVLSQTDKDALLGRDGRNIVGVDLPHLPLKEVGPDAPYDAAGATLRRWRDDGVLLREPRPALYAYEQSYTWAGRAYRRRMIIAGVRLAEFGQGVWPHEKTFRGPKADRMKLTRATDMYLSAIFGFYEDGADVTDRLFAAAAGCPDAVGVLDGVEGRLWTVCDEGVIEQVRRSLARRELFIADGHHRYTTALSHRNALGGIDPDHPGNFVMFALAAMDDPGLIILPVHRVIRHLEGFDLERLVSASGAVMDYRRVELADSEAADAEGFLRPHGRHAMAFAAGGDAYVGRLKDAAVMARVAGDQSQAWRELDVAILHRLVLEHYLSDNLTERTSIEYVADGRAALAAARTRSADLVVFLQSTPLRAVREIARAGAVMPHKSTYFYPKPATGMVLYPLTS